MVTKESVRLADNRTREVRASVDDGTPNCEGETVSGNATADATIESISDE